MSLFSGPDKPGGLNKRIQWWVANVRTYDLDISADHDLVDEATWEGTSPEIDSETFDGIGSAPPCSTFSAGRRNGGGPMPLRGEHPPDIYGFKFLTPKEKEQVRIGTVCAYRGLEAANKVLDQNKCFLV